MKIDFGVAILALFRLCSDPDRVRHSPAAQSGRRVVESQGWEFSTTPVPTPYPGPLASTPYFGAWKPPVFCSSSSANRN